MTFARIKTTSDTAWSTEISLKLKTLSDELKYHSSVVGSLNQGVGQKLDNWTVNKDESDENTPPFVVYILANSGAIIGDRYDLFFRTKSIQLEKIQDSLFSSIVQA